MYTHVDKYMVKSTSEKLLRAYLVFIVSSFLEKCIRIVVLLLTG